MKKVYIMNSPFKSEHWGQSKVGNETRQQIIQDKADGMSTREIMEKHDVTKWIVYYAINQEKKQEKAREYMKNRREKGLIDKDKKNQSRYKTRQKKIDNPDTVIEIDDEQKAKIRQYHNEYLKNWRKEQKLKAMVKETEPTGEIEPIVEEKPLSFMEWLKQLIK